MLQKLCVIIKFLMNVVDVKAKLKKFEVSQKNKKMFRWKL